MTELSVLGWGKDVVVLDIMRTLASTCASTERGTCTAIWSPSKSALKAIQTMLQLNRLAFDQYRLKKAHAGDDAGGRGTVENDRRIR